MLKKMCVIYKRGGVTAAARILAPDEKAARMLFFSNKLGYAGCGTEIVSAEEYKPKLHDGLIEVGKTLRTVR